MDNYIDSRGAEVAAMSYSEALEIVHELAASNVPDAIDVAFGDAGMATMREHQQEAVSMLEDLVVNHFEKIDDDFEASPAAREWPQEVVGDSADLSPTIPSNYIRICLAMAENAAIDPTSVQGIEQADECDRQQQAFDVVRDFLGLHGATLDEKLTVVKLPGNFFD